MWHLLEKHLCYKENLLRVFYHSHSGYIANGFGMKFTFFNEYMHWLFPLLTEFEKRIHLHEDPYQRRVIGFVAERLLCLFIHIKRQQAPLRIKELPWSDDRSTNSPSQ